MAKSRRSRAAKHSAGDEIAGHTDAAAPVRILTTTPSEEMASSPACALARVDEDGKTHVQPTGSTSVSIKKTESPAGFTAWGKDTDQP